MKGQFPSKDTQFPRHRQNHTKKHPNGYLVPKLKKLLNKKFRIKDPETEKIIKMAGADGVMLRLIWNALQGETPAIKEILERFDGKVKDKVEHSGEVRGDIKVNVNLNK